MRRKSELFSEEMHNQTPWFTVLMIKMQHPKLRLLPMNLTHHNGPDPNLYMKLGKKTRGSLRFFSLIA